METAATLIWGLNVGRSLLLLGAVALVALAACGATLRGRSARLDSWCALALVVFVASAGAFVLLS